MIPDLSVLWVIVCVLLLSVLLDRLLFRPIARVMQERESAVKSARELAEAAAAKAQAAAAEFEARTLAARTEVYRQMDEHRREALERRAALLATTRQEVEASIAQARATLQQQAEEARQQLEGDADGLASAIVERVLGRKAS